MPPPSEITPPEHYINPQTSRQTRKQVGSARRQRCRSCSDSSSSDPHPEKPLTGLDTFEGAACASNPRSNRIGHQIKALPTVGSIPAGRNSCRPRARGKACMRSRPAWSGFPWLRRSVHSLSGCGVLTPPTTRIAVEPTRLHPNRHRSDAIGPKSADIGAGPGDALLNAGRRFRMGKQYMWGSLQTRMELHGVSLKIKRPY